MLADHLQKTKKEFKRIFFKKTGDTNYIYKNELDKACFHHDMAYRDFKNLARWTASDKVLRDKAFNIGKNPKYDGNLFLWFTNCFNKKSADSSLNMHANNKPPLDLAEELQKPIIRKFIKRTVHSRFKDNIWGADLAYMQLISKFNKIFRFLLCVIACYKMVKR